MEDKQIVNTIEALLQEEFKKQTNAVVSVILGWNFDYTEIECWLETEWDDYSNPYSQPNFIVPNLTFATLLDSIACGKIEEIDLDLVDENVDFKNLGDQLIFNDSIKNELVSKILYSANYSLITITKQLCQRQNLTSGNTLLSFKINNLGKSTHATLATIYGSKIPNKLFKAEFENIENEEETEGFVSFSNEEIVFYRTNEDEKSNWENVFKEESNIVSLKMECILDFGLQNEFGDFTLLINHKKYGNLSLSLEYEMDKHFSDEAIVKLFLALIRENSNAIEKETHYILTGPEEKMANRKEEDIHPNDRKIAQMANKVILDSKPLNFLPYLEKNLNTETPNYWNVTDFNMHKELGTSLLFFKRNDTIFNFTREGLLVEFSIDNDKLVVKSQKQITKSAANAYYFDECLYITTYENDVLQYNLKDETEVTIVINKTNFDNDIDHIFVNEAYMTLCSIDGLAIYRRANNTFEFLDLVTVGTTQILYTWAKQALIYKDYLYITAGNTGLVTYKLDDKEKPKLLHVLSPECENPFCDKIDLVGFDLLLEMEGNHWLIDISEPEQPKSKVLLVGGPKKEKMGPILLDNFIAFIDGNQPLLWKYSFKNNGEVVILCEHIAKDGKDVYLYYPKNYYLEGNTLLFSGNYGYSVLKRAKTPKIDYTPFKQIELKEDTLYHLMEQELENYFKSNNEISIGKLEIEPTKSGFKCSVYSPEFLIRSMGYTQNKLFSTNFSWADLDLHIEEPDYPYYAILNKELKNIQRDFIKKILIRFSKTSNPYWNSVVFYTYKAYNERTDRNEVYVENVKQL